MTEKAAPNYKSGEYVPPAGPKPSPTKTDISTTYVPSKATTIPSVDEIPIVQNNLNHIASSGYGIVPPASYDARAVDTHDGADGSERHEGPAKGHADPSRMVPNGSGGFLPPTQSKEEQTTIL